MEKYNLFTVAKHTVRRQDVEKLETKVRTLQRFVSKLRRRLERYETVEHEFYTMDSLADVEKSEKFSSPDAKQDQAGCEICSGEVALINLGPFTYLICKGCLKKTKVA